MPNQLFCTRGSHVCHEVKLFHTPRREGGGRRGGEGGRERGREGGIKREESREKRVAREGQRDRERRREKRHGIFGRLCVLLQMSSFQL